MDEILAIESAIKVLNESTYVDADRAIAALRRAQDLVIKGYMFELLQENSE